MSDRATGMAPSRVVAVALNTASLRAVYNFNRNFGEDAFNLNAALQIRPRW